MSNMLSGIFDVLKFYSLHSALQKRRFTLRARPQRRIGGKSLHLQYTNTAVFDICHICTTENA